jgi:DNA-binding CsgD family transcriptional regulator
LAAYTLWLLVFPMKGPLLGESKQGHLLLAFLLPHSAVLLSIALLCPSRAQQVWLNSGVCLTAAATLAFPWWADRAALLMPLLGCCSALALLKAGTLLRGASQPWLAAAAGLALGNALLFLLLQIRPEPWTLAAVPGLGLAVLLSPGTDSIPGGTAGLYRYLPFILVFSLVSGLGYDLLKSGSAPSGLPGGAELFAYILAVCTAYWFYFLDRDLCLVLGILFAMLSLSLGLFPTPLTTGMEELCLQASAGFVDLFLLAVLLEYADSFRAFGLGIAALCLGVATGEVLSLHLGEMEQLTAVVGNAVLTLAVLLLYILGRERPAPRRTPSPEGATSAELAEPSPPAEAPMRHNLPQGVLAKLSEREKRVLGLVAQGLFYREIAREIGISESSVKTYMRRMCEKAGVSGRRELIKTYFQEN